MTIAHLSDLHFGRIARPEVVDRILEDVHARAVDLVVVSGDLTQRARRWQFQAAAEMLGRFQPPTLVVPGNHDVYAWWYPVSRLFRPLRRYRRYITDDLTPTYVQDGLAVLGINSATGRTVKGGHISRAARRAVRTFFAGQPASAFKVLVVHHHLIKIQALAPHDVARAARDTLEAAVEAGVDLVLCGHLHISHVEPVDIVPGEHRLVIASAGTATSSRGRRSNRRSNFYNVVTIEPDRFSIEERRFHPAEGRFETECRTVFDRVGVASPT